MNRIRVGFTLNELNELNEDQNAVDVVSLRLYVLAFSRDDIITPLIEFHAPSLTTIANHAE